VPPQLRKEPLMGSTEFRKRGNDAAGWTYSPPDN